MILSIGEREVAAPNHNWSEIDSALAMRNLEFYLQTKPKMGTCYCGLNFHIFQFSLSQKSQINTSKIQDSSQWPPKPIQRSWMFWELMARSST